MILNKINPEHAFCKARFVNGNVCRVSGKHLTEKSPYPLGKWAFLEGKIT
jgi:hypothetical protein